MNTTMNNHLKELTQEELYILIKFRCDRDRKSQLERMYKNLFYDPSDIITSCKRILSHIGYFNTSIYIEEVMSITSKIGKDGFRYFTNHQYSEDTIALVLVTEILDYYKAKYNEMNLLELYEIDKNEYINLKIMINLYLSSHYWNKS
jgi:hypothetical protein